MKKQFLNLGKTLSKAEQKETLGGRPSLSCVGKNIGASCATSSNPTAICCSTTGSHPYLYCIATQYCIYLP